MDDRKSLQFIRASLAGDLSLLQQLSKDPSVNINWQHDKGFTPFIVSCQEGRPEIVRFFLSLPGLDLHLTNDDGISPFYEACTKGHMEIVSLLLADKRININQQRDDYANPFFTACEEGHVEIVALLLADKRTQVINRMNDDTTPFLAACLRGHVAVVKLLLADKRIDLGSKSRNCLGTPFYFACQNGHEEVVSLLVDDPRIDVESPTDADLTPVWVAALNGHFLIVQRILASGRGIVNTKRISRFCNMTIIQHIRHVYSNIPMYELQYIPKDFPRMREFCPKIVDLLERYEKDPENIRKQVQRDLRSRNKLSRPVFHSSSLRCCGKTASQGNSIRKGIDAENKAERNREIEKILAGKVRNGKKSYLVRWRGCEELSWEPEKNCQQATVALREFLARQTKQNNNCINTF